MKIKTKYDFGEDIYAVKKRTNEILKGKIVSFDVHPAFIVYHYTTGNVDENGFVDIFYAFEDTLFKSEIEAKKYLTKQNK